MMIGTINEQRQGGQTWAPCSALEHVQIEQLRLENEWLRQRLQAHLKLIKSLRLPRDEIRLVEHPCRN